MKKEELRALLQEENQKLASTLLKPYYKLAEKMQIIEDARFTLKSPADRPPKISGLKKPSEMKFNDLKMFHDSLFVLIDSIKELEKEAGKLTTLAPSQKDDIRKRYFSALFANYKTRGKNLEDIYDLVDDMPENLRKTLFESLIFPDTTGFPDIPNPVSKAKELAQKTFASLTGKENLPKVDTKAALLEYFNQFLHKKMEIRADFPQPDEGKKLYDKRDSLLNEAREKFALTNADLIAITPGKLYEKLYQRSESIWGENFEYTYSSYMDGMPMIYERTTHPFKFSAKKAEIALTAISLRLWDLIQEALRKG